MNESAGEHPSLRSMRLGRAPMTRITDTAARTDVGRPGEEHAYRSGTSVFFGFYDEVNDNWVYAEYTP